MIVELKQDDEEEKQDRSSGDMLQTSPQGHKARFEVTGIR